MSKLSVKDFVIDLEKTNKEQKKKVSKTSKYEYKIILENNTDFVLNKKTKTTDKNLVFLISQGVFYIQNNKGSKQIETITEQKLRGFFRQIYNEKFEDFKKLEWWGVNQRTEKKVNQMLNIIDNPSMQEMYKHHIIEDKYDCNNWITSFKKNKKLFEYCYKKIRNNKINRYNFERIIKLAIAIDEEINFNNAKYLIDKIATREVDFYINSTYNGKWRILSLIKEYNLEFNRIVDYLTQDLYSQGLNKIGNDIIDTYKDYLKMQVSLYGKVKEKYPKYLKTEHDIITLKFNTYEKHKKDLLIFNIADKYKNLGYKTKNYSIILPKTSIDIIDEGINQSHCVGSYVDRVAKNESLILFMRDTNDLEKSLITIEILDEEVTQVRGFGNRFPTKEEEIFLKKWSKEKKLKYNPDRTKLN